jgi:hypothetical protein
MLRVGPAAVIEKKEDLVKWKLDRRYRGWWGWTHGRGCRTGGGQR